MKKLFSHITVLCLFLFMPCISYAAEFSGEHLSLWWGVPFVGILLSIALFPLFMARLWHHHYGKIIAIWTSLFIIAALMTFGFELTVQITAHAILEEYIPFILLLLALFTVSGGILIKSDVQSTPKLNVCLLALGTLLASIMGTTGAAMLMIRPLIRANRNRQHRVHIIVFFIFLVANIGGGLTPLGDPPLFIGFLKGIDFFWTVKHMLLPVILTSVLLLIIFYFIDKHYYSLQPKVASSESSSNTESSLKIYGLKNIVLLLAIVGSVSLSGIWQSDQSITLLGSHITLPNLVRDGLFIAITLISLVITPKQVRAGNEFNWEPILEVSKLFIGIFITIAPVLAILRASHDGALAPVVSLVTDKQGLPINTMYFWLSGVLSGFLDNAPTYLVFFNLASGDPLILMTTLEKTLLAISMGSVFMGALTYIGNAPNFMVKSIASQNKIAMPSFFGYMKWSIGILIPIFVINSALFFMLF